MFHAAPDRNWFLHLVSLSCVKVVQYTGEGCTISTVSQWVFAVEQFKICCRKANGQTNLMIQKIFLSNDYSPRNCIICFSKPKLWRKAEPSFSLVFFTPIFASFCYRTIWNMAFGKANEKMNLMISKHLKIRQLQPKKSWNMFEQIQILKKSWDIVFDFPFSFRCIFMWFCRRTIWNTTLES